MPGPFAPLPGGVAPPITIPGGPGSAPGEPTPLSPWGILAGSTTLQQPALPSAPLPVLPAPFGPLLQANLAPWMTSALALYARAIASMFDPVAGRVWPTKMDGQSGFVPGWGVEFDVNNCPTGDLGYLAQYVGVQVPAGSSDATARALIKAEAGINRGTVSSVVSAAQRFLSGSQSCQVIERTFTDGSSNAYWFLVVVRPEQLVDANGLTAAVNAVKPGGVGWSLVQTTGFTWGQASRTWVAESMTFGQTDYTAP